MVKRLFLSFSASYNEHSSQTELHTNRISHSLLETGMHTHQSVCYHSGEVT
jgi:hypothetical protein